MMIITFLIFGGYLTLWYWDAIKGCSEIIRKILLWLTTKNDIMDLNKQRQLLLNEINKITSQIN